MRKTRDRLVISALVTAVVVVAIFLMDRKADQPQEQDSTEANPTNGGGRVAVEQTPPRGSGEQEAPKAQLSIRVTDLATGALVPESAVFLVGELAEEPLEMASSGDGTHTVSELPGGYYQVRARGPNYLTAKTTAVIDDADGNQSTIAIELTPLSALNVEVVGEDGRPFPDSTILLTTPGGGAMKQATLPDGQWFMTSARRSEVSDADGVGRFAGLAPGSGYQVHVTTAFQEAILVRDVDIPVGTDVDVTVETRRGARIVGRITACDGTPGDSFFIDCLAKSPGVQHGVVYESEKNVHSTAIGTFELNNLRGGEKRLRFKRYRNAVLEAFSLVLTLLPGEEYDCGELGPPGRGTIAGVVMLPTGEKVDGAKILVSSVPPGPLKANILSDRDGSFSICGVKESRLKLRVQKEMASGEPELRVWSAQAIVEPSDTEAVEVQLVLEKPEPDVRGSLEVLLTGQGEPFDLVSEPNHDTRAYLRDQVGRWRLYGSEGLQDDGGVYSILKVRRAAAGVYSGLVIGGQLVGSFEQAVIEDGMVVRMEVELEQTREIVGKVTDSDSGRGVNASIRRVLGRRAASASVETSADGTFSLRLFRPDEPGKVVVRAPGYQLLEVVIDGLQTDLGELRVTQNEHE